MARRYVFRLLCALVLGAMMPAWASAAPRLWVDSFVLEATPHWVNAQLTVRVRFWHAVDARLESLDLSGLRLAEAVPLGPMRSAEVMQGGQRYRRSQRDFAVMPYASGALDIRAVARGRSPAGHPETQGRTQWQLDAPSLSVKVLPVPAEASEPWLPVRRLALRWQGDWSAWDQRLDHRPTLGSKARRVLVVEADGVDVGLLPDPVWPIDTLRWRVLSTVRQNEVDPEAGLVRARLIQTVEAEIVRADASGAIALPLAPLQAWSVQQGAPVRVSLPAESLVIALPDIRSSTASSGVPESHYGDARWVLSGIVLLAAFPGLLRFVRLLTCVLFGSPHRVRRLWQSIAFVPDEVNAVVFGSRPFTWRAAALRALPLLLAKASLWHWPGYHRGRRNPGHRNAGAQQVANSK